VLSAKVWLYYKFLLRKDLLMRIRPIIFKQHLNHRFPHRNIKKQEYSKYEPPLKFPYRKKSGSSGIFKIIQIFEKVLIASPEGFKFILVG
jgi:hypothetical protein